MIILGMDTALRTTGYGVIACEGKMMKAVDCGVIKTAPKAPHSECLARLGNGIEELIKAFEPKIGVIEGGFYGRNVKTAMVLGMARGVVVSALARHQIPVFEYAPRRAKQAVVGYGNATKEQVAQVISMMLKLNVGDIPTDSTDAMAIAMCHALTISSHGGIYTKDPL